MLLRGRPCRDALAQNGFNFRGYILLARVYEGTLSPVTPFVLVETLFWFLGHDLSRHLGLTFETTRLHL